MLKLQLSGPLNLKSSCQTHIPRFHPFGSRLNLMSVIFHIHKGLKLRLVVLNGRLFSFILWIGLKRNLPKLSRDFLILASSILALVVLAIQN